MPAGITIYHDAGTVQIDENYQNLFVVAQGTGGTIPSSGFTSAAMVAVQSSSLRRDKIGGAVPAGVKWWVFDVLPASPPDPGYGFRVYTATGKVAFDATWKPMRLVGTHGPITGGGTYNYPSGRSYAAIMRRKAFRITEETIKGGGATWDHSRLVEVTGVSVSGGTLTLGYFTESFDQWTDEIEDPPQGTHVTTYGASSFIVADVTAY